MGNPVIGCEHDWLAHYTPVKSGIPDMFFCTKCGLMVDPDEYGCIPGELEIARRELEEATGRKWLITASGNLVSPPTDHPGLKPFPGSKLMIDEIDQGMSFLLNGSPGKYPKVDDGTRRFPEGGIVSAPEQLLTEYEYMVLMAQAGDDMSDHLVPGAAYNVAYSSLSRAGFINRTTGKLTPIGVKCHTSLRKNGYPRRWKLEALAESHGCKDPKKWAETAWRFGIDAAGSPTGRLTASRPEFAMPYGTKRQNMGKTESLADADFSKVEERVMAHMATGGFARRETELKQNETFGVVTYGDFLLPRGSELKFEVEPDDRRAITPLLLFSVMTLAAVLAVAAYWPTVERWLGSAFAEALIKFSPFG